MDPYHILQIQDKQNFTFDQLRRNFKKLVLEYHPDRANLNEQKLNNSPIFQSLKFSYDYLLRELESRNSDKTHAELKAQAQKEQEQHQHQHQQQHQQQPPQQRAPTNVKIASGKQFDIGKFNQMFSEARIDEAYDQGYGDWKDDTPPEQKAIITFKDPEPFATGRFATAYELGQERVDDYSGDTVGTNLKFMDFKLAHTTTLLVDPTAVDARPEFKTVEQVKQHRAQSLAPTEADVKRQAIEKARVQEREAARLEALKQKDTLVEKIYKSTHKLLLDTFSSK